MTDEDLLRMALSGGETDWEALHEVCKDRTSAEALARLLEQHANAGIDAADAWAQVLGEMHPGLRVNLPPEAAP